MKNILEICIMVALAGCSQSVTRPAPVVPESIEFDPATCRLYCDLHTMLGCDGDVDSPGLDGERGTEDDIPCEETCSRIIQDSVFVSSLTCMEHAGTCGGIETCLYDGDLYRGPK